ncbi:hypothetical protein [Demequina sp.]|uniref:hypothetical protein n=1 Tax=Demequina sp. TaxID=2050685 RepID=UPI0025C0873C|nr:hypothetical protein [Demequina sp.]
MAAFDGVDLRISSGGGALVELNAALADSHVEYSADGRGDVVVPARGLVAIVRGVDCSDYDGALAAARELTEDALKRVAPLYDAHALIVSGDRPRVAWWTGAAGSTIRITGAATWTPVSPTWGDKRRAAFELLNPYPAPDTPWHAALKHYRSSELSEEAKGSAGDLYLALASALSARVSRLPHESERHWLLRSLRIVDREVDLAPFAPPESSNPVPEAIRGELYRVLRRADPAAARGLWSSIRTSSADLMAARARYATMFRQLARAYVGITFPALDPTESMFNATVRSRPERSVVWIGDEHATGLDTARGRVGEWHPGGARLRLPTRDDDGGTPGGHFAVIGRTSSDAVEAGVGVIRSFGTLEDERVTSVANLTGALDVGEAAAVEVVVTDPR